MNVAARMASASRNELLESLGIGRKSICVRRLRSRNHFDTSSKIGVGDASHMNVASGMRAVGGNGVDVRAAADVGDGARSSRGGRRDGGEIQRGAATFARVAF